METVIRKGTLFDLPRCARVFFEIIERVGMLHGRLASYSLIFSYAFSHIRKNRKYYIVFTPEYRKQV